VSISLEEVRHIAALAQLGLDNEQVRAIASELNSILDHMHVLARAEVVDDGAAATLAEGGAMVLRPDAGPAIPLQRPPADFAPAFRDGFFLVPRLATHEGLESAS
jgi:aspartyl-tRNA(Asn)/glutamyl-tRNA(Gln) amidotransferase subunit C